MQGTQTPPEVRALEDVDFMYLVFTRMPGGVSVGSSSLCCMFVWRLSNPLFVEKISERWLPLLRVDSRMKLPCRTQAQPILVFLYPIKQNSYCVILILTPNYWVGHRKGQLTPVFVHSSGAVWESRWTSWAVRPNEPSGFRGRKAILNHASALVSACP